MKKCPKCSRFDIEYDPVVGADRCLWRDCGWVNKNDEDLENDNFICNFSKFREHLENKISQT